MRDFMMFVMGMIGLYSSYTWGEKRWGWKFVVCWFGFWIASMLIDPFV